MIKVATLFTQAGDKKRDHFLGAIGIRKDGAIVVARNEPTQVRTPSAHAEARLVKKLGKDADLVVVVRVTKNGALAMAKPCKKCALALKNYRVKKVFYTTENGMELLSDW